MRAAVRWMAWAYDAKPRKLLMPDAGGCTSSVKTWLLLYTDAKLYIYIYFYIFTFLSICKWQFQLYTLCVEAKFCITA